MTLCQFPEVWCGSIGGVPLTMNPKQKLFGFGSQPNHWRNTFLIHRSQCPKLLGQDTVPLRKQRLVHLAVSAFHSRCSPWAHGLKHQPRVREIRENKSFPQERIIQDLKDSGIVPMVEFIVHNYLCPHWVHIRKINNRWRLDTPHVQVPTYTQRNPNMKC